MRTYFWLNAYNKKGNLICSEPFNTKEEAIAKGEEMAAMLKMFNIRREMRIEGKGDMIMHLRDVWVAVSANYTQGYIPCDYKLMMYLYERFGICGEDVRGELHKFTQEYWARNENGKNIVVAS